MNEESIAPQNEEGDLSDSDEDPTGPSHFSAIGLGLALPLQGDSGWILENTSTAWLFFGIGLGFLFLGSLLESSIDRFSPARLLITLEKKWGKDRAEALEEELDRIEDYRPGAAFLKILGLTATFIGLFGLILKTDHSFSAFGSIALAFLGILLLGDLVPTKIADSRADPIAFRTRGLLRLLYRLSLPLLVPTSWITRFVTRNLIGIRDENNKNGADLAEEIQAAVEDSDEEEKLAPSEIDWIKNVVSFREKSVVHVMTPRTEIVGIEANASFQDAVKKAVQAGHSRLPVYRERIDEVIGVFYIRDAVTLLADPDSGNLQDRVTQHMRECLFVPRSKKLGPLLEEFRKKRVHIGIVLDEWGGTFGLVSVEDILEEIVGEIEDEYDSEREELYRVLEEGSVVDLDARMKVDDLNELLGERIEESEDYETVGGYLSTTLGRIPRTGETFQIGSLEIEVLSADDRRTKRLRVRVLENQESAREEG
ncbi:MAG TPA: HlyC/CorC family transporter [Planctomycetes bacterium]|nr:HlyC/CorC family transporter [Planctomycetota bacterium]